MDENNNKNLNKIVLLVEQFHRYLISRPNLLQYVKEKTGLGEDMVKKYKLGWSARSFLDSTQSCFRNRLAFPVYDVSGNIRVIRFKFLPGTPGTSSQTSPVLNLWSIPGAFLFMPNYIPEATEIWIVRNEFEAILLDKGINSNGSKVIVVGAPMCRPHITPVGWYGWDCLMNKTVTFFSPSRKYDIAIANRWAFDIGKNASVCVYPEKFSDLQSILGIYGDKNGIDFLLALESKNIKQNACVINSVDNGDSRNVNREISLSQYPKSFSKDIIDCVEELARMCHEIGYPGFFYLADLADGLNKGMPYFMRHYWNWHLVRKILGKIGIKPSKQERTKKGYKIYLSGDELKEKIDKFKR